MIRFNRIGTCWYWASPMCCAVYCTGCRWARAIPVHRPTRRRAQVAVGRLNRRRQRVADGVAVICAGDRTHTAGCLGRDRDSCREQIMAIVGVSALSAMESAIVYLRSLRSSPCCRWASQRLAGRDRFQPDHAAAPAGRRAIERARSSCRRDTISSTSRSIPMRCKSPGTLILAPGRSHCFLPTPNPC